MAKEKHVKVIVINKPVIIIWLTLVKIETTKEKATMCLKQN